MHFHFDRGQFSYFMRRSCTDRRTQQFQQWYSTTWSSSSSANLRREVKDRDISDLYQDELVSLLLQRTLLILGKVGTEWRHGGECWECSGFCVEKDIECFEERALPPFGFMTSYHALLISVQLVCPTSQLPSLLNRVNIYTVNSCWFYLGFHYF